MKDGNQTQERLSENSFYFGRVSTLKINHPQQQRVVTKAESYENLKKDFDNNILIC